MINSDFSNNKSSIFFKKTDSIEDLLNSVPNNVLFMTKTHAKNGEETIYPINIDDKVENYSS